jgi:hypothetical protein
MSREYATSKEKQIQYISDRYKDVDTTLRLELASLPGIVEIVQRVGALDTTHTPEEIDKTMAQVNALCKKMTQVVRDACMLFEELDPNLVDMETTENTVLRIPDSIHTHIRSIDRFFDSESMNSAILDLMHIRHNIMLYAPIVEEITNVYNAIAELQLIIDNYIVRYPQSTM